MIDARRAAKAAGALAVVAVAALATALIRYEGARDAWRVQGAAIGTATYDADASDTAYLEVEGALAWIERAARGAAVLVVATGIAIGRVRPRRQRMERTRGRRIAARAIDLTTLALALATSRMRAPSPGTTEALAWLAPALALALLAGLAANGATLGDRLVDRR